MEKSDAQLISECLNGDENSLRYLIDRHLKAVYNFVYRLVGNKQDSEDVVQESFLKVWKNLKKYKKNLNFKTWLFKIARNAAIDFLRKKKDVALSVFENDDDSNFLIDNLVDPEPLPDELIDLAERKKILDNALSLISPLYKEVLLLHYVNCLTFDEIGKILGKSINTVKSRHRRALIVLKELLNAPKQGRVSY